MGGALGVESTLGRGSHFWFTVNLPECNDLPTTNPSPGSASFAGSESPAPSSVPTAAAAPAFSTGIPGTILAAATARSRGGSEAVATISSEAPTDASALGPAVSPGPPVAAQHPLRVLVAEVRADGCLGAAPSRVLYQCVHSSYNRCTSCCSHCWLADAVAAAIFTSPLIRHRCLGKDLENIFNTSKHAHNSTAIGLRVEAHLPRLPSSLPPPLPPLFPGAQDNPINLKVVMGMLRRLGFQGEGAPNGAEAVKKLVETQTAWLGVRGRTFDLILMDLGMPVMVRHFSPAPVSIHPPSLPPSKANAHG